MYEKALAIDPNDAAALAGEAYAFHLEKVSGWTNPAIDYDAKVLDQADRSIAIDRDDPLPYMTKSIAARRKGSEPPMPGSPSIQIPLACMRREVVLKSPSAISNREKPTCSKRCG